MPPKTCRYFIRHKNRHSILLHCARSAMISNKSQTTVLRSKSSSSNATLPALTFEKSRMSLIDGQQVNPRSFLQRLRQGHTAVTRSPPKARSPPNIPFIGGRLSWPMLAKKALFASAPWRVRFARSFIHPLAECSFSFATWNSPEYTRPPGISNPPSSTGLAVPASISHSTPWPTTAPQPCRRTS
ncbi:MAG: hypothetical protein M2R45_00784 [Verrucomicrobia subdivision 3 bacterium]|nr:hypothetical protein [Limisphaerales bacterium]MCS1413111.1 hypothetical protein [Limisphaerales bacterium]